METMRLETHQLGARAALIAGVVALPMAAQAQGFTGQIGVGAVSEPTYSGSDKSETSFGLDFDIEWGDRYFLNEHGIGGYVYQPGGADGLRIGFALGYDFTSRSADDDARLVGLTDVDGSPAFSAFLEYEFGIAELEFALSKAIGSDGHEGLTAEAGVEFSAPLGRKAIVSLSPYMRWGDDNYTSALYGVTAAEAGTSSFSQYTADSGVQSYGVELSAAYQFTDTVGIFGAVDYNILSGDAADSPIVFDDNQVSLTLGLFYSF